MYQTNTQTFTFREKIEFNIKHYGFYYHSDHTDTPITVKPSCWYCD